jgi:tetratricopeptide (TPR) repeat protein
VRLYSLPLLVLCVANSGACASRSSLAPSTRPSASMALAGSVESSDPRLAAAIIAKKVAPSAESNLRVAFEYARLGILDGAHTWTAQALAMDPSFASAHEMMGRLWRDWGQPKAGLPHVYRAIYYEPGSASAQNTLGTILDALGQFDAAQDAYQRAVALDPKAGWALSNLCYLEMRRGRYDEARKQCEAALVATPALAAAQNNLGLTYAAAGDMLAAQAAFVAGGDRANAFYNLGIIYLATDRNDEALRAFESAIEARPQFTAAKTRAHEAKMRALKAANSKR